MNIVYAYSIQPKFGVQGIEALNTQIRLGGLLWNELVACDHRCRKAQWDLLLTDPEVSSVNHALTLIEERIEALYQTAAKASQSTLRTVKPDKAKLDALRKEETETANVLFLFAKAARARCTEKWDAIDETRQAEELKAARTLSAEGLWQCNVDEVRHTRYRPARIRINTHGILMWRPGARFSLRHHSWDGTGSAAVRLRYSSPGHKEYAHPTWPELWGAGSANPVGTWLRFSHVKDLGRRWSVDAEGHRQPTNAVAARVAFRVGSVEGKHTPVMVEMPVIIHRTPPAGAEIALARIVVSRIGAKLRYSLQLTMHVPDPKPATGQAVGIDLNWRHFPDDTLRVATAATEDGGYEHLYLPSAVVADLHLDEELRSRLDEDFNIARGRLVNWLDAYNGTLPDFLQEARDGHPARQKLRPDGQPALYRNGTPVIQRAEKRLREWRSRARFERLILHWRQNRFPGDDAVFSRLDNLNWSGKLQGRLSETWARNPANPGDKRLSRPHYTYRRPEWRPHNKHLDEWKANLVDQAIARRRHVYRQWAHDLCQRCGVIVLEKMNLSRMARSARVDDPARDLSNAARRNRTLAALSDLRQILRSAAVQAGVRIVEVEAKGTTLRHLPCGHDAEGVDFAASHRVSCPVCRDEYDQDENAASGILERGLGMDPQDAKG